MNDKSVLKELIVLTLVFGVLSVLLFALHVRLPWEWMLATAITFLTIFYHFVMRLIVGQVIMVLFRGKVFPQDKLGFRQFAFEKKLYRTLKVKQWKLSLITARPEQFDVNQLTPEELLHNMMQAELGHRIIMALSFVPLLFIIPFGTPLVFVLTSVGACLLDCPFVMIQRYNRPRVIKYLYHKKDP